MKDNKKKWPLIGNEHIVDFLDKSIVNDKVSGSYIFTGAEDLGKTTIAFHFAKKLFCQQEGGEAPCDNCPSCAQFNRSEVNEEIFHSDFYLIKKEEGKKNISIEQVRDFINSLGMSSFLNSYKIGIIKNAETLSTEAANALLKTLEEPKNKVIIVLIATDVDSMPQTIVSRSKILEFRQVPANTIYDYLIQKYKAQRSVAKNLSRLCLGRPALAIKFFEDKDFYNEYLEKVNVFLNFFSQNINERIESIEKVSGTKITADFSVRLLETWQGFVRDLLLANLGQPDLIQNEIFNKEINLVKDKLKIENLLKINQRLQESKRFLKSNVNPKLVLENVVIGL